MVIINALICANFYFYFILICFFKMYMIKIDILWLGHIYFSLNYIA